MITGFDGYGRRKEGNFEEWRWVPYGREPWRKITISVVSLGGSTLVGPVIVDPAVRIADIALEASRALGARCTLAYGTEVLKCTRRIADYQVDDGAVLVAIIACIR